WERNRRVEADKAWETSWARIGLLCLSTYVVTATVLIIIGTPRPALAAVVPATAYLLSTQTLPQIKARWLQKRRASPESSHDSP
ncbi:MAG: hypothetical protein KDD44_05715, partial [Bdellovibrionales bacterium]|nr:hypothetical protein [Bdellovibrionales bacterium]